MGNLLLPSDSVAAAAALYQKQSITFLFALFVLFVCLCLDLRQCAMAFSAKRVYHGERNVLIRPYALRQPCLHMPRQKHDFLVCKCMLIVVCPQAVHVILQ